MDTSHKKGATKAINIREGLLDKDADGHKGPRRRRLQGIKKIDYYGREIFEYNGLA